MTGPTTIGGRSLFNQETPNNFINRATKQYTTPTIVIPIGKIQRFGNIPTFVPSIITS